MATTILLAKPPIILLAIIASPGKAPVIFSNKLLIPSVIACPASSQLPVLIASVIFGTTATTEFTTS